MDITVHHVELSTIAGEPHYVATVEIAGLADGFVDRQVKLIPTDAFESRAAEYEIDPTSKTGWDDLLHIVLYEGHVEETTEQQLADPEGLFLAPTVRAAREAKLGKLRALRGTGKLRGLIGVPEQKVLVDNAVGISNSGDTEDPLAFIKRTAPMSREHIAVKREFTRRTRNQLRAAAAGREAVELADLADATEQAGKDTAGMRGFVASLPARESADELAVRLLGPAAAGHPDEQEVPSPPPRGRRIYQF